MELLAYIERVFNRLSSAGMEDLDLGEDYVVTASSGIMLNRQEQFIGDVEIPRNSIMRMVDDDLLVITKDVSIILRLPEGAHLVAHKLSEVKIHNKVLFDFHKTFQASNSKHEMFLATVLNLQTLYSKDVYQDA